MHYTLAPGRRTLCNPGIPRSANDELRMIMVLEDLLEYAWNIQTNAIQKLAGGNINETYAVGEDYILQWLNPIFGASVNEDIAALVPHLLAHGVPVPRLLPTKDGALWISGEHVGAKKGVWRLMNKLPGRSRMAVENIEQIRNLSAMLARFHLALADVNYTFKHTRGFAHDFMKHWRAFDEAFEIKRNHPVWNEVRLLREKIEHLLHFISPESTLTAETRRMIHGDPKCANFLFEGDQITGVIDLDTISRSFVACDLGDAIRSWCNAHSENDSPEFRREDAREAIGIYLETMKNLTHEEREKVVLAPPCIALELGVRFARDALCEDYFGFDPEIGHAKHSLIRAQNQIELASQMLSGSEI